MMEQKNLAIISRLLPRFYLTVFLGGIYSGLTGVLTFNIDLPVDHFVLRTLAFPAYGVLFGMAWLGVGPLLAIFLSGLKDGLALKSYLMAGGSVYFREAYVSERLGSHVLSLGAGLMDSLSLLYASTAGMYLGLYLVELYLYGVTAENTHMTNFTRRIAVGLFLSVVAIALRVAL